MTRRYRTTIERKYAEPIYEGHLKQRDRQMVSRIKKTLTVQQRAAVFEHTNTVATKARDDEARERAEKTARLRELRHAMQRCDDRSATSDGKHHGAVVKPAG